ncbi:MAG TPA: class IV adenylate cyclase [Methanobacterium sp.]|jgi:adenylate cyclase class 2|nr:MAG: class IV adenylate cyclase [Methanobacterium sp.]HOI71263.1 class IV adenylate cyclase [Methanobacterium sp.]
MIEVEVKAHVTDFNEVEIKLTHIGARKRKIEHQKDIYFNAPHKNYIQTDEALRIREIPEDNGSKFILTYKGAKLDNESKTRREIEVVVNDGERTVSLLENLDFNPVRTVRKDRTIYSHEDYTITLDKVYDVGNFVEIERSISEGEDYQSVLQKIFEIYQQLGIQEGFERRSYLELLDLK